MNIQFHNFLSQFQSQEDKFLNISLGHVPKTAKPSGKSMLGELPHRLCKLGQHCQSPSLNSVAGYGNERPIYILKTKPAGIAPP